MEALLKEKYIGSSSVYYGGRHRFYTADLTMSMPVFKYQNRAWVQRNYDTFGTHASTTAGTPNASGLARYLTLENFGSTSTPQYESGYWLSDPWDLSAITNVADSFIEYCACARNGADVEVKVAVTNSTSTEPSVSDFTLATTTTTIPGITAGDNLYGKYLWLKIEMEPNRTATGTPCLCRINLGINDVATTTSAHNTLQSLTYTYDAVGNITSIVDLSGFGGHKTVVYTYDDLYRLTNASTTVPANNGYNQTFTYDRIGNIATTSALGDHIYAETGFTNPHGATAVGGTSLTYDNNGNVTDFGNDDYVWNYRDRLTKSVVVGGADTFYGYDFNNDRVAKGNGTATTTYANKYYNLTAATTTKHVFDNSGILLATIEGNGEATSTNFVHTDHLSSITVSTDEDGDVTKALDYYPFGSERVSTGVNATDRHYIGERYDSETSLNYLNERYYGNSRGQFMSQDPVARDIAMMKPMLEYILTVNKKPGEISREAILSNPQLLNSYSYSTNNPVTLSDPSGKFCFFCIPAAGAILDLIGYGLTASGVIGTLESFHENFILPHQYPDAFTEEQKDTAPFKFGVDVFFNFGTNALPSQEAEIFVDTIFEGAKHIEIPQSLPKSSTEHKSFGQNLPQPRNIPSLFRDLLLPVGSFSSSDKKEQKEEE